NLAAVDEVSAVTSRPVVPAVISEVRLVQALNLFYGRQVPIEFRNVLLKLERNEERRLYRNRATVSADLPVPNPLVEAPERVRPIAIEGDHPESEVSVPVPRPVAEPPAVPGAGASYTAPFVSAEMPTSDLADSADFLPGYAPPPRTVSPEEQARRMWK